MATGVFTQFDIGLRHNIKLPNGTILGERNFEPVLATAAPATVQYQSRLTGLWWVNGVTYNIGQALPYDVSGTTYSLKARDLLQLYWDNRFIDPTT
jgi:hypothetical protein